MLSRVRRGTIVKECVLDNIVSGTLRYGVWTDKHDDTKREAGDCFRLLHLATSKYLCVHEEHTSTGKGGAQQFRLDLCDNGDALSKMSYFKFLTTTDTSTNTEGTVEFFSGLSLATGGLALSLI